MKVKKNQSAVSVYKSLVSIVFYFPLLSVDAASNIIEKDQWRNLSFVSWKERMLKFISVETSLLILYMWVSVTSITFGTKFY